MGGDPRFFQHSDTAKTARELSEWAKAELQGDEGRRLAGVAPLHKATELDVSFFHSVRYRKEVQSTEAGLVITNAKLAQYVPESKSKLICEWPLAVYARIASLFYSEIEEPAGIHPSAVIDPSAHIAENVRIGPFVYIGPKAEIGAGSRILSGAHLGQGVVIGKECFIGANASVRFALVGDFVRILSGARLGERGYGFAPEEQQGAVEIPQLGRVLIEDRVEVGANACIDRGSGPDTKVGYGTMIDDLVMIAHNCNIGRFVAIAGQAAIAGSVTIGDFSFIGGNAALAGHITIGKGAQISGCAAVMRDVEDKDSIMGYPAEKGKGTFKKLAFINRLMKQQGRI